MDEGEEYYISRKDLVWENSFAKFFKDYSCLQYERTLNSYDEKGVTLPDRMTVYYCEPKDGTKPSYIAFDTKGKPYMEWIDPYDLDFRLKVIKMDIEEENDLVNMAKRKKEVS